MIVRCLQNKKIFLPKEIQETRGLSTEEKIIIGKEYVVYAVMAYSTIHKFCLYEENFDSFPMYHPMEYFSIVDPRLSRYWICRMQRNITNNIQFPFFGIPEWANDEYFYGRLADGCMEDFEIYLSYKKLMDLEFPNNTITERAQIGDEKWLICPLCMDAWEYPDDKDAMVVCPMCQKMQHNPRYKNIMPPEPTESD